MGCQTLEYSHEQIESLLPCLMFRSLIHFEFIFVYGVRKCSSLILFVFNYTFPCICLLRLMASVQSLGIGEGNGNPPQYSCLENPMDGGAWWAAAHGVARSRTQLSDFTFTFHSHALEKEMATHSSVLAWRIPGMGEPGGLPSVGSHRVGHD